MNPVPSDAQWLVLYQIEEGEVFYAGEGAWRAKSPLKTFWVTGAVKRLHLLGLVDITEDHTLKMRPEGYAELKRRSVYDVLERHNGRGHTD